MHPDVDRYIEKAPPAQRSILLSLRAMLLEEIPGLEEHYKWSRPVYSKKKDLLYLKSGKTYATLGFFDAAALKDPGGLLEGTGKSMRHVKIRQADRMDADRYRSWFRALAKG